MSNPSTVSQVFVLLAAGAAIRLIFLATAGVDVPIGEDLEFWLYRGVTLELGRLFGTHPPLYPALVILVSTLTGLSLDWAGTALSFVTGAAVAPAVGLLGRQLGGPRAGWIAGGLALLWPATLAWTVRVEPTGLFLVLAAGMMSLVAVAARHESRNAAIGARLLGFSLVMTKESGFVHAPAALAALAFVPARKRLLLAGFGAFLLPLAVWTLAETVLGQPGVAGKATVPARDLINFLRTGEVPVPLWMADDPWLVLPDTWLHGMRDLGVVGRSFAYMGLQALRLLRFLGIWLPVAVIASVALVRAVRERQVEPWAAALVLLAQLPIALSLVVVVQARHAEPGLIGTVLAVGLVASLGRVAQQTVSTIGAVAAVQLVAFAFVVERDRAGDLAQATREGRALTAWVQEWRPEGTVLCSTLYVLGVNLREPVRDCFDTELDPEGPVWLVVRSSAGKGPGAKGRDTSGQHVQQGGEPLLENLRMERYAPFRVAHMGQWPAVGQVLALQARTASEHPTPADQRTPGDTQPRGDHPPPGEHRPPGERPPPGDAWAPGQAPPPGDPWGPGQAPPPGEAWAPGDTQLHGEHPPPGERTRPGDRTRPSPGQHRPN